MSKLRKTKLSHLIVGVMIIAILITICMSVWSSYRSFNTILMQNQQEEYVRDLATVINNYLQNISQNLSYSTAYLAEEMADEATLVQEIERIKMQNHVFDSVTVVNKEGIVLASTTATAELWDEWKSIEGATKRGPAISKPFQASEDKQAIVMSYPIYSAESDYVGLIGGTIYLTEHTIFRSILGDFLDDATSLLLVDSEGQVILGQTRQQPIPGKSDRVQVMTIDGETVLVGYGVVPFTNWELIVQRPLDKGGVSTTIFIKNAIIPLLPFLLIVFLMIIWWAVKIAQPIHQLSSCIGKSVNEKDIQHLKEVEGWYFETYYLKNTLLSSASFIRNRIADLRHQLVLDPLTGIKNRRIINEVLNEWVMNEVPHTLILLDLDYFKSVNDTYGHTVGDEVLKTFAKNMQDVVDQHAICCRYGGEEFLILLPYATIETALEIAEKLRVKQAFTDNPCGRPVTFSAGIATFPTMAKTSEQLIEIADEALYKAKKSGRNCIRVVDNLSSSIL